MYSAIVTDETKEFIVVVKCIHNLISEIFGAVKLPISETFLISKKFRLGKLQNSSWVMNIINLMQTPLAGKVNT